MQRFLPVQVCNVRVEIEVVMCLIILLPNDSARLSGDGVKNIEAQVVNHVGLLFSNHTARLVRQCLEEG